MAAHFTTWRKKTTAMLKALGTGCHPKQVIVELSEDLLRHYHGQNLIDAYDIYQHLMDYWAETMQDDLYLIAADGWKAETYRIIEKDKKGKERDKGWACDLVPKPLIVARYFPREQAEIDELTVELGGVAAKLTDLEEEHSGEDGPFAEIEKLNKANVGARLKEIKGDKEAKDENAVLSEWLELNTEESELKRQLKEAEAALDAKAYAHYPLLGESEVKLLAVDDKWMAALGAMVNSEMDRVSQEITQRVRELTERYEIPLPQMLHRVANLEKSVRGHMRRMGFDA
jgi:type I restriction enzyme M protein